MIVRRPSGFIEPCQPSKVARPPSGPLWVHEIKHDGYRLVVRRDGARVRCFTRGGHDWADRFPAIVEAAPRIQASSFMLDGEAEARLDAMRYRWRQLNSSVDLSKVQSVDQRMRLGVRCRLSPYSRTCRRTRRGQLWSQKQPCRSV